MDPFGESTPVVADGVIASSDGDWAEIYQRNAVIAIVRVLSFSIRLH